MKCSELTSKIEDLQPEGSIVDVARLSLLMANKLNDPDVLAHEDVLKETWRQVGLSLQMATDQHAAMSAELEELASSNPESYTTDQVWVLIRAIKVQSQVLQLYVGQPKDLES